MAISSQKHYLDLVPGVRAPITVHVSQGDSGTVISFVILENGIEHLFTTESVVLHGTRMDGANFGPFACTYNGSTVSFSLNSAITAIEGSAIAELSIVGSNNNKVGTANFAFKVERSVFPEGVTYSNDLSVFESILQYAQTSQSSTISNAVNTSKSYTDSSINAEATTRANVDNQLSERVSNLVVAAGGSDITEVVDARTPFSGSAKTALKNRLDLFLEYTIKSATEDIDG